MIFMADSMAGALVRAVREAGTYALNSAGGRKAAHEIEKRCRERMLREIRSVEPGVSIWGDERGRGKAVSLCPIDSIMNYSRGMGFASMAAYCEGGMPVLAAVSLPERGEIYTAERGKGARCDGRKLSVAGRESLSSAVVLCGSDSYLHDGRGISPVALGIIEALARMAIAWRNPGSLGTAYALLAAGRADGVIEPARGAEHAAGCLLALEAGATITDRHGERYSMLSDDIIAAAPGVHAELLGLVSGSFP
jgi:myo-inositol-1(or 4)-monophosphatase